LNGIKDFPIEDSLEREENSNLAGITRHRPTRKLTRLVEAMLDLEELLGGKVTELASRPAIEGWAACAAIWTRLYVLAGPGLRRWPDIAADISNTFLAALRRGASIDLDPAFQIPIAIRDFRIEDDGSDEWGYVVGGR
jgi:hypothetical protein